MRHPVLTFALLCTLMAPLTLRTPMARAEAAATSAAPPSARVIVQFKAGSSLLRRQALSAPASAARSADPAQAAALHASRAATLGGRLGFALAAGPGVSERAQVVTASGITSEQLARRLAADSEVDYAVVDQRRRALVAPNDPLYTTGPPLGAGSGGPAAGQWYLRAPDATVRSSIDIEGAWALTTGSANVVVAVLDTGLRFDHVDLLSSSAGGNVLPGYDFVTDTFISNDGDGRDADASDPGDWVTSADVASPANTIGCDAGDVQRSSWHGTETGGLIGAATGNGIGMAGVGHGAVRLMPVRVLGKCGGFDSDIQAGMRWAAGLAVPGIPSNPTPAKVINLSLGGNGGCSPAYVSAITEVNAVGAVVVASAGNSEGHPVTSPANCAGVIAVAGLRHVGTKVGFSDLGPEIALSAPGGNCVNVAAGSACLYPILTLSNSGTTTPAAGGSIYTDAYQATLGTSFSAPLVAGTAALMLSAQPALTPAELRDRLRQTATAFPTSGGDNGDGSPVPVCQAPVAGVDQDQCYCTTSTCGAGMLNAAAAVRAAADSGLAVITPATVAPFAGQPLSFSAANSRVASTRTIVSYAWTLTDGGGIASGFSSATDAATVTLTPSAAGRLVVGLVVTDSAGVAFSASQTVTVAAAPVVVSPAPGSDGGGGGGGGALGLHWLGLLATAVFAAHRTAARRGA